MFIKDRPVSSLGVFVFEFLGGFVFEFLGALFFEIWVLRFQDLGASFSSFGCFVLRSSFSKLPLNVCTYKHNCVIFIAALQASLK